MFCYDKVPTTPYTFWNFVLLYIYTYLCRRCMYNNTSGQKETFCFILFFFSDESISFLYITFTKEKVFPFKFGNFNVRFNKAIKWSKTFTEFEINLLYVILLCAYFNILSAIWKDFFKIQIRFSRHSTKYTTLTSSITQHSKVE